jgi:hypothetical protein
VSREPITGPGPGLSHDRPAFHAEVLILIQRWHKLGLVDDPTRRALGRYQRSTIERLCRPEQPAQRRPPARQAAAAAGPAPAEAPSPSKVNPKPVVPAATVPVPTQPAAGARAQGGPRDSSAPPVIPLPLPRRPDTRGRSTAAAVGHFLRERTWWLVGAALTVVGSFFVAGTVWSDLGTALRLLTVLVGLALYTLAFAALGHRLARQPGGRRAGAWLLGVSVALAPVLAMAAGSGWELEGGTAAMFTLPALAGVSLLLAWRLPRDMAALLPASDGVFRWIYLGLSLSVGLLPLAPSPAWLLLPASLAAGGLWWALTRWRRLPSGAGLLLLHPLAFHAYLAPHGWSGAYAPSLALAALAVLYLDAALGRWRGVHALKLRGLRGVLALGLAGLALLLLLPGFDFLPSGPESAVTGMLLVPFFLGAALCWRRPALILGALLAALLFTLALPDLFWAVVEPFRDLAKGALGYQSEPLPLAWYSLTLLPYLLVCRLAAGGLRRSGWRQARAMSDHAWRWTFALSLLLVVLAHGRVDDLRPALLALPLHGLLWLREHRARCLVSGTLPWVGLLVWVLDLLWHSGAGPELRLLAAAGVVLALIPAGAMLARRLGEHELLQGARIVAVPAALLCPLLMMGWEAPALALLLAGACTWLVSLGLRPLGAPPSPALYQLESALALLGQALLLGAALAWAIPLEPAPLSWAAGLEIIAVAFVALAWWLPRHRVQVGVSCAALEVWAHALALAAVVALLWLEGWDRSLMKLPIALLLVWWMSRRRWRIYGAVLVFGVAESVLRRLWGAELLEPGSLVVLAVALCWLPALVLHLMKRSVPRFGRHWIHCSLGQPAGWMGLAAALVAPGAILVTKAPGPELQLAAVALVAMILAASALLRTDPALASRRLSNHNDLLAQALELGAWLAALGCAMVWALQEPQPLLLPWLSLLPPGLALLWLRRPSAARRGLTVTAVIAAGLIASIHGPLEQLHLLVAGAGAISMLALRGGRGWIEGAIAAWLLVLHAALIHGIAPGLGWHLALSSAAAALLLLPSLVTARAPRFAAAARRAGLALALLGAAAWACWLAVLSVQVEAALWPVGLALATALLWAYRQGTIARLLAPWTISAALLAVGAADLFHPLSWLAFAAVAWLLSPRRASDRVGTRALCAASAITLAWLAVVQPALRPAVALGLPACGLLATHTGSQHRWAWGGLAAGLLCAAALEPLEPVAVLLRSSLAFTLVAGLRHLPEGRPRLSPQATLWLAGSLALGLCSGTWTMVGLALAAGLLLLARSGRGLPTRGPRMLEEPAGWVLLLGSVALRIWDQGGSAEWFLMAAAIPFLAWSQPRPWLFLASLPLLAWLPGELLAVDFTVAWPTSLAALALLSWALRDRLPAPELALRLCVTLASFAALLALVDRGPGAYALLALPIALAWWLAGWRAVALLQISAGLCLVAWDLWGLGSGMPALVLLATVPAARWLEARWLELLAIALLIPACTLGGAGALALDSSAWQCLVLAAAMVLSIQRTMAQPRPERWWSSLAWVALLYLVLRLDGPLAHLDPDHELPLLLGLGVLLELAALAWEPNRGADWVRPLRQGTALLAGAGLLVAILQGGPNTLGLALAGCLFCLRYVLRGRWSELIVGVLLLDVATVMLHQRLGWTEPLAWIGPTGLSLLVVAQILRQGLDPRIRDALRWAGACCIYITALGQAVFDPAWTLGLVLLSLAGLAMGSLLRVRAFLFLGSGFLASALITELLRFGLSNARFWAFYLTSIGLCILAGLVALTLFRPQLAHAQESWRERLRGWD